jgi:FkbM family methyltransferase
MKLPPSLRRLLTFPSRRHQFWRYKAAKEAFDALSDSLAEDPLIKAEEFGGSFRMDVRSDMFRRLVIYKQYEPLLAKVAVKFADSGRDFIDVGANVGFYSVLLARNLKNGRGYAIEPTAKAFARLQANLKFNGVEDRVTTIKAAVTDRNGSVEIRVIPGKEEYSSLGGMNHPSVASLRFDVETVPAVTLDDLVERHGIAPGFLKIDVEGCEHMVLAGAHQTLLKFRPVIMTELWDPLITKNGSSSRQVIASLRDFGYRIEDPISGAEVTESSPSLEILCLPS